MQCSLSPKNHNTAWISPMASPERHKQIVYKMTALLFVKVLCIESNRERCRELHYICWHAQAHSGTFQGNCSSFGPIISYLTPFTLHDNRQISKLQCLPRHLRALRKTSQFWAGQLGGAWAVLGRLILTRVKGWNRFDGPMAGCNHKLQTGVRLTCKSNSFGQTMSALH